MTSWAVRLPGHGSESVVRLWRVDGIDICRVGSDLWLRGSTGDETIDARLRALPHAARFVVGDDGQLRAPEARVPHGWLPPGPWTPLRDWFEIKLPRTKLPGEMPERVPLRLVPVLSSREPLALLTTLEAWSTYAAEAPQIRLDRWRFAVAENGRALIYGQPLPPLPGERLLDDQEILVPAGWDWKPHVEAAVVRTLLNLPPGDLMVWHTDQRWEHIPADQLVLATRLAVRSTAARFQDG